VRSETIIVAAHRRLVRTVSGRWDVARGASAIPGRELRNSASACYGPAMSKRPVKLALVGYRRKRSYSGKEFRECDRVRPAPGWPAWKEDEHNANEDKEAFRRYQFRECKFPQRLTGVRFIECAFTECDFQSCYIATAEFYKCNFRECRFDWAAMLSTKLKFNVFRGCNFTGTALLRCDLYRSYFVQGNVFQHAQLGWVSITRADLSGTAELRRASFLPPAREPLKFSPNALAAETPKPKHAAAGLPEVEHLRKEVDQAFIQEDTDQYKTLLGETETKTRSTDATVATLLVELVEVYRMLSAVWMAAAAYDDAAWAYRESKKRKRESLRPRWPGSDAEKSESEASTEPPHGDASKEAPTEWRERALERLGPWWQRTRHTLAWLGLLVAGPASGFGTRMRGIFACLGAWVALYTLMFVVFDAVKVPAANVAKALPAASDELAENWKTAGLLDCFRYSIGQLVTTPPQSLKLAGRGWEIVASIETLVGIGLLGLLGFVLANRLRFS
jgi:hypothetical protein